MLHDRDVEGIRSIETTFRMYLGAIIRPRAISNLHKTNKKSAKMRVFFFFENVFHCGKKEKLFVPWGTMEIEFILLSRHDIFLLSYFDSFSSAQNKFCRPNFYRSQETQIYSLSFPFYLPSGVTFVHGKCAESSESQILKNI